MQLLVGLGNPGPRFCGTRHNVGFEIIDSIRNTHETLLDKEAFCGLLAKVKIGEEKILTLKPTTFMNESGKSVSQTLAFYKIPMSQMVILHDDLDLPLAQVKIKNSGSSGGHNGIKSVISCIGDGFLRLRFGIDRPNSQEEVSDYVLEKFSQEEAELVGSKVNLIAKHAHLLFTPKLFLKEVNNAV